MKTEKSTPSERSRRSDVTQARIIKVAKNAFAEQGYAATSLSEIVDQASVTTGAIYHHFNDKKGLFRAVAESLEEEIMDHVMSVPLQDDPWDTFMTGLKSTLRVCARPDINRIVFKEAPSVIGPTEWREIEVRYAFGVIFKAISRLSKSGAMYAPNPGLTSQIILGSIIEAANVVASSDQTEDSLAEATSTVLMMVSALRQR